MARGFDLIQRLDYFLLEEDEIQGPVDGLGFGFRTEDLLGLFNPRLIQVIIFPFDGRFHIVCIINLSIQIVNIFDQGRVLLGWRCILGGEAPSLGA